MTAQFATGAPYWALLTTPHFDESIDFYTELFGWEADKLGPETGPTVILSYQGAEVAGMGPASAERTGRWTPYFKVDDAEACCAAIRRAGGTILSGPVDAMGQLTMAVFAAPDGAVAAIGQPAMHQGSQRWGAPGALTAVLLLAADPTALNFYREVFGWRTEENPVGAALYASGDSVPFGNMHVFDPDNSPPGTEPGWSVVFKVDDVDGSAARAGELGGSVVVGPMDVPGVGRNAFLLDPHSAGFGVV